MSISIDVKGLEEVQRKLQEMQEALTVPVLNEWAKKILDRAKSNAPSECEAINLGFIEMTDHRFAIEFSSPRPCLEFVKAAIQEYSQEMPITARGIFETLLAQIEKKETESKQ